MKHILLLIIFIILFKLSLLFVPLKEGLWSISAVFATIGIGFFLYLLFQLKNLEIITKHKVYVFFVFLFIIFLTITGWNSLYSIIKTDYNLNSEISAKKNKTQLKTEMYTYLLNSLNKFNKNTSKTNLKTVFIKNTDLINKDSKLPSLKSENKNLVIYVDDLSDDIITLIGLDTSSVGTLPGFKNFGNTGEGFVQFKATLTLGGIKYERQN